ncbi:MAG TPA: hypothetical protein DC000_02700 [Clostridiales bacterium]|nr:hypothetical protein [Clostridiales bacterium]
MEFDLLKMIPTELLIIVVATYCLGMFLKNTKRFPNWLIPLTLLLFAILISIVYAAISLKQGVTAKVIVDGIINGILIASVAVFYNQMLKQIMTERKRE